MSRSSLPEISPLKMQARSEPRRRKARCPSRTRHILVHLSWSLPKRRNGFWRIRLQTCRFWVRSLRCIRFLFTPHRNLPRDDVAQLENRVRRCMFQVSSLVSCYASLNTFPFALNVDPGCFLHCLKSLGLFFRCSNADATTSALGMSGSAATEKHVDLPWCEIRRTNL